MRNKWVLAASAAAFCMQAALCPRASAQAPAAPQPQADGKPPAASAEGVTSYPASFFARSAPLTALDMVMLLPGFTFSAGSSDARGYEASAGNVLVDGQRPASKNDPLDEVLKRIPPSAVERIDVIRGAAPGIDMQGKTIVANVVRKVGGGSHGVAAVGVNAGHDGRLLPVFRFELQKDWGARSLEAGLRGGGGIDDGSGSGPRVRIDGAGNPIFSAYERSHGTSDNYTMTAAYAQPLAGGKLRLSGSGTINPYKYDGRDFFAEGGPPDHEHDVQKVNQGEASVTYTRPFGADVALDTLVLQRFGDARYTSLVETGGESFDFGLDKQTRETIARAIAKVALSPRLSLEAGGEGAFNTLDSKTAFIADGAPVAVPAANVTVQETRGEAVAIATWRPLSALTLEAGLRYERSTIKSSGDLTLEKTFGFAKPRFMATWSPDQSDQLRLRIEREVSQLNFDDFVASNSVTNTGTVQAGNPDLNPQQDWVIEGALERRFWGKGDVTLTLRHYELSEVIDRAPIFGPAGVFDAPGNIGDGVKQEAQIDITVPLDALGVKTGMLKGTAVWRSSEVTDPTTRAQRAISGLRPVEWELHFTQDQPKLHLNWGIDANGAWRETYFRFDEVNTRKLGGWLDVFAEFKLAKGLTLRTEVDNILAHHFKQYRTVYDAPRAPGAVPAFSDLRDPNYGQILYLRLRKTM